MNLGGTIPIQSDKVDFPVKDEDWVQGEKDKGVDKVGERLRDHRKIIPSKRCCIPERVQIL